MKLKFSLSRAIWSLCFFSNVGIASDNFPGIEKLMNEADRINSGISSLSKTQLEALNQWLVRYTANDAPTLQIENSEVKQVAKLGIKTRILGEFSGWTGKTIFVLENGQTWQQRRRGRWKTSLVNPEVILSQNFIGAYELSIVGGKTTGVKRISP